MNNLTLVYVAGFFGFMATFFWLAQAAVFPRFRRMSLWFSLNGLGLGLCFVLYPFRNDPTFPSLLIGLFISDLSIMMAMYALFLGTREALKVQEFSWKSSRTFPSLTLYFTGFIILYTSSFFVFFNHSFFLILNSFFISIFCTFFLGYTFFYISLFLRQTLPIRLLIASPVGAGFVLSFFRSLDLLFGLGGEINLTSSSLQSTIFNLGIITDIVFVHAANLSLMMAMILKKMEHIANTDRLTGLYNRHYLHQIVRHLPTQYTLIHLDVDFFKPINDHYGHDVGDLVLKNLSDILRDCVRQQTTQVFRVGGEEFTLLVYHTDSYLIHNLCRTIHQCVQNYPWNSIEGLQTLSTPITLSLGFCRHPFESHRPFKDIWKASDHALYRSKHNGRNQTQEEILSS